MSPPAMARDVVVKLRTAGRIALVRVWRYIVKLVFAGGSGIELRGCDVFVGSLLRMRGFAGLLGFAGDGGSWLDCKQYEYK